ncbi:MAG: hypothetical protein NUV58_04450 [Candidatus Roizmanbacteria bacterium]|nr:hypothetical protein [Candidatus Roizmanbacteria bacterium]
MKNKQFPIDCCDRSHITRIGQHEVGHYIVARILGFQAGDISLTITDLVGGHIAGSEIELAMGLTTVESIIDYLENRVIVLYAGALAESLTKGRVDNKAAESIRLDGGKDDDAKARELIRLLRNIKFSDAQTEDEIQKGLYCICDKLWDQAANIVKKDHEIIEGLGSRLASEITHTGKTFILTEGEIKSLPAIQARFREESEK